MGFGADHESPGVQFGCNKCGASWRDDTGNFVHVCRDPHREFWQAVLDGRVYLDGGPWEDRDGHTHWQMTVKVESDD